MNEWLKKWLAIEIRDEGDEWLVRIPGEVVFAAWLIVLVFVIWLL